MPLKLLSGYETILLLPVIDVAGVPQILTSTALVPATAPTVAALNEYISITSSTAAQGHAGGNISCAVLDDLTLGLDGSDTDDTKTVCSKGNSEDPTFYNHTAELNLFRDDDITATGVFNLARDLTRAPDVSYLIGHRVVGQYDSTANAVVNQEWDFYRVDTDNPVPGYGDGEYQTIGVNFIPKGWVNTGYRLAA